MGWLKEHDKELERAVILVGNTGIRVRELANLTKPDLDLRAELLHVTAKADWTPKDFEERSIHLNRGARAAVRRQFVYIGGTSDYLFPRQDGGRYGRGLDLKMCRACRKAGLKTGGFHRLRHTFATRYMENGGNLTDLTRILGHSSVRTTEKYLHPSHEHMKRTTERVGFGG